MKRIIAWLLFGAICCMMTGFALAEEVPAGYPAIRIDPSTGKAYDFGGATIYIYDYWSGGNGSDDRSENPTEEQAAQYAYRDWLMSTYNCHIVQKAGGDWGTQVTEVKNFVQNPDGSYRIYIVPDNAVSAVINNNTAANWNNDLVDLEDDKWNSAITDLTTVNGSTLGVAAGKPEPTQLLYFNKSVLSRAGIDYSSIYDMQKDGTWTWSALTNILGRVQRDTDGDGVIDVFGLVGSSDDFYRIAVFSNGGSFFTEDETGALKPAAQSDETQQALRWAKSTWNTYAMPKPEGANWDWYKDAWKTGKTAFYMYQAYGGFNSNSEMSDMAAPWGAVAFPIGPSGSTYVNIVSSNITVLPKVYDTKTTAMLAMIYDLWTMPTPGFDDEDSWVGDKCDLTDERAVYETYGMLREYGHCVTDKVYLLGTVNDVEGRYLLWNLSGGSPAEVVEQAMPNWQALCDAYNLNNEPIVFSCNAEGILTITTDQSLPESRPWSDFAETALQIVINGNCPSICDNAFSGFFNVTTVSLPGSITSIGASAFSGCELTDVFFAGTEEQWHSIAIGSGNEVLLRKTTKVHFNYVPLIASGTCGENLTWTLDEKGLLTISGEGTMDNSKPWNEYLSVITCIRIDEGVTTISNNAFSGCDNLNNIVFPNSLLEIGSDAFANCKSITSINIPNNVTIIKTGTFDCCYNLSEVVLPNALTTIADFAFSTCTSLSKITLPVNLTTIERAAFHLCTNMKDVYYAGSESDWQAISIDHEWNDPLFSETLTLHYNYAPGVASGTCGENLTWTLDAENVLTISGTGAMYNYVTDIQENAPWRWESATITGIEIGEGVTSIGDYTFRYMTGLSWVNIPRSVTRIGANAFEGCNNYLYIEYAGSKADWDAITVGDGNDCLITADISFAIDTADLPWTFADGTLTISGTGPMRDYDMPYGETEVFAPWWEHRSETRKIVIEDGITSIGAYAFYGYTALTSVDMADSVGRINQDAFGACTGLSNIRFSAGLTIIWRYAFEGCSSLTTITLPSGLKYIGTTAFAECGLTGVNVTGNSKTWDFFYAETSGNHLYHIALPESVSTVDYGAFYGNAMQPDTPDFVAPSSLTTVEAEAFSGTSPSFVLLSESTESIGSGAFAGCAGLKYVYIPYGCSSIAADAIPKTATVLVIESSPAAAFAEANGYTFLYLEDPNGGNG